MNTGHVIGCTKRSIYFLSNSQAKRQQTSSIRWMKPFHMIVKNAFYLLIDSSPSVLPYSNNDMVSVSLEGLSMTDACYGFLSTGYATCQTSFRVVWVPLKKSLFILPTLRVDTPKYTNTLMRHLFCPGSISKLIFLLIL